MKHVVKYALEMHAPTVVREYTVTQNDTIEFVISLSQGGEPIDMTGVTPSLAVKRRDGVTTALPGTVTGNTVTFALGSTETAKPGTVQAAVQLYGADGRVSSLPFTFQVKADLTAAGTIPSEKEATLIEVVLQDGPAILQRAETAAADAERVAVENKTNWLDAVATVAERDTAYPSPKHGDTVRVTGTATVYRFETGKGWVVTDQYQQSAVDALNQQLADNVAETNEVKGELALKRDVTTPINLDDVSSDVLDAIQGGSGTPVNVLSIPKRKSVSPFETEFFSISKNLFNPKDVAPGYSVSDSTGAIYANSATAASGFIPVEPNTQYTRSYDGRTAFYDAEKKFISGHNDGTGQTKTITTPAGAYYMRSTISNTVLATFQVEKGATQTPYVPYEAVIPKPRLNVFPLDETDFSHHSIPAHKMDFFETGKNLFSKNAAALDKYVDNLSGQVKDSSSGTYAASDFIPVEPNTQYTRSYDGRTAFYDYRKVYIGGHYDSAAGTFTVTTPSNAAYMRTTLLKTDLNSFQVEKGANRTNYEPYREYLSPEYLPDVETSADRFTLFSQVSVNTESDVFDVADYNTAQISIPHSSRCKVYLYGSKDADNWDALKTKNKDTSQVKTIIYTDGEWIVDVTSYNYFKAYVDVADYEGIYIDADLLLLKGYPQTYTLDTVEKKSLTPSIIDPAYERINSGQFMFAAGPSENIIYGVTTNAARVSTDGGRTFTTLFSFNDGANAVQLHYIKEDDTLIATRSDGGIWKSDKAKTTFTKVHQMETPNMSNGYLFGFSHYDNVVVIAEYGAAGAYPNNPNKVYVSLDYGQTFTRKFAGPTDRPFHCHDVLYDPYSRIIWQTVGDSYASSNIYYSLDFGDTWHKVYEDGNCPSQWTSMAVLPNCVLFMTDAKDVGVWRWDRLNEKITANTDIQVVHAFEIKDDYVNEEPVASTVGMTYGAGAVAYFGFGFFPNHVPEMPCKIWGTSDGYTFHDIWEAETPPISSGGTTGVYNCDVTVNGNIISTYVSREGDATGYYLLKIENPQWA